MNLSKNFTLAEMMRTSSKYENIATAENIANMKALCTYVLQPLRDWYGKSIKVNSGFRSPLVNKSVGGSATSEHKTGHAADITAGSNGENKKLFDYIRDNLEFGQLINEYDYSWIHVSYNPTRQRNEVWEKTSKGYKRLT